jgi:hypothetical protein
LLGGVFDTLRVLAVRVLGLRMLTHICSDGCWSVLVCLAEVGEAFNVCNIFLVALVVHHRVWDNLTSLLENRWNLFLHLDRVLVIEIMVLLLLDLCPLKEVVFFGVLEGD